MPRCGSVVWRIGLFSDIQLFRWSYAVIDLADSQETLIFTERKGSHPDQWILYETILAFYSEGLLARTTISHLSLPFTISLPVIKWNVFWARRRTWSWVGTFIWASWFTGQSSCGGLRQFAWGFAWKRFVRRLFFCVRWQFYCKTG